MKTLLIYYSASGNTATVARIIKESLAEEGIEVISRNVAREDITDISEFDLIGIGFPIYEFRPPKILMEQLKRYDFKGKRVFIFATYGTAWPGDAIDRVANLVRRKGGIVVGGLLVPMTHTYSFMFKKKLIRNLSEEDVKEIKEFAKKVSKNSSDIGHFHRFRTRFISSLAGPFTSPKLMPGVKVDTNKCTKCGACFRICPTGAIYPDMNGYPRIDGSKCLKCYLCIKSCKYGALKTRKRLVENIVHTVKKVSRDKEKIVYKV